MGFASETKIKAVRKAHLCDGCNRRMEIGSPATRWAGTTDGDFGTAIYHSDCRQAEVALNDLCGWQDGDDWWPLSEIERESWPWLIETFPAVAERLNLRAALSPSPATDEAKP